MLKNFLPNFYEQVNRDVKLSCKLNYKADCCKCYYTEILCQQFYFHILCYILKPTLSPYVYLLIINSFRISQLLITKIYRKIFLSPDDSAKLVSVLLFAHLKTVGMLDDEGTLRSYQFQILTSQFLVKISIVQTSYLRNVSFLANLNHH